MGPQNGGKSFGVSLDVIPVESNEVELLAGRSLTRNKQHGVIEVDVN